ncbi:TetR/AcrR family transcriptional regulator [Qingshengfaniella alkalisoli]|uniref:TetR/AcrR family transcriptional regulator n=1 Tax=Qingshengfaniella alkalisoli TaxID=2599296 RepID=UPI00143D9C65|nr:TetR/AcrR family transcriptional regulator [Qingshengfaniella alkalisoli]
MQDKDDVTLDLGATPTHKRAAQKRRAVLNAAREEFVEHGFDGARIDRIADRSGSNKRMLYHYVGNKEELYKQVLLEAYHDIRQREKTLDLKRLPPVAAMEKLVGFTFDHFRSNPWFIRLLSNENMHRAEFIRQLKDIPQLHSPIIDQIGAVLAEGEDAGVFRKGVDPVQLYISIAGLSYFYFSNIYTLSVIFDIQLESPNSMIQRRSHAISVILGYLTSGV